MSDTATDLTPAADPQAPPAEQAQPEPQHQAAPEPADDDALEPELASQVIDIPEGERLVPLSALTATRRELKAVKEQARTAGELQQQVETLRSQQSQQNPVLQAAQALLLAQRASQPQPPQGPDPAYVRELDALARDLDLYKADGHPDLEKAHRIHQRQLAVAQQAAQQATQPIVQHTLQQEVDHMTQRAAVTEFNGQQADPAILQAHIEKIKAQPGGLQMLANEEYMKVVWKQAWMDSVMTGKAVKTQAQQATTQEQLPPPVFTEKSGGSWNTGQKALSPMEAKAAKDLGMSQAEYLKHAGTMPW